MGGAKDAVDQVALFVGREVGVDVLPHHFAGGRCLENASEVALRYQRVAVGQAAGAGDVGAEKVERRVVPVLPHDFVGRRVNLNDAGRRQRVALAVRTVVVNQDVAVVQQGRVVLLGQRVVANLPGNCAAVPLNDAHGGYVAEAEHYPAVGQRNDGVAVAPFVAQVVESDDMTGRVQMVDGAPLPDAVAGGVHGYQHIAPHTVGAGTGLTALHPGGVRVVHPLHRHIKAAAGRGAPGVVVMVRIPVFPEDVAVPVGFQHYAALEPLEAVKDVPGAVVPHFAAVEQVAVGQQVAVQPRRVGHLPLVRHLAGGVQQIDSAIAGHRGVEGMAGAGALRVVGGEARAGDAAAGLLVNGHYFSLGRTGGRTGQTGLWDEFRRRPRPGARIRYRAGGRPSLR